MRTSGPFQPCIQLRAVAGFLHSTLLGVLTNNMERVLRYALGNGRLAHLGPVLRISVSGDALVTRKNYVRLYVWSWC